MDTMDTVFILLGTLLVVLLGGGIVVFFLRRELGKIQGTKESTAFSLLKQDLEAIRKEMGEGLRFSTKEIQRTLSSTQQAYASMMKELGSVQEIGRDMKNLQEFFRAPKARGNLGEEILEEYLERVLPKQSFERQYGFKEGTIIDAVIKTNQGFIPIDAKFTTESFQRLARADSEEEKDGARKEFARAVKRHVDDIARKYILPQEGTVDFAVMYVPSEPVYYEVLTNLPELSEYAAEKHVYIISPKTLYYFLKTILIAFQGAKIEEAAKKILRGFQEIRQESLRVGDELQVLSSHIDRAKTASGRTQIRFEKLTGKIETLSAIEPPEERKQLES